MKITLCTFINTCIKNSIKHSLNYPANMPGHRNQPCLLRQLCLLVDIVLHRGYLYPSTPVHQPRRAPVPDLPSHYPRQSNAGLRFGPVSIGDTEKARSSEHIPWLGLHDNKHLAGKGPIQLEHWMLPTSCGPRASWVKGVDPYFNF